MPSHRRSNTLNGGRKNERKKCSQIDYEILSCTFVLSTTCMQQTHQQVTNIPKIGAISYWSRSLINHNQVRLLCLCYWKCLVLKMTNWAQNCLLGMGYGCSMSCKRRTHKTANVCFVVCIDAIYSTMWNEVKHRHLLKFFVVFLRCWKK